MKFHRIKLHLYLSFLILLSQNWVLMIGEKVILDFVHFIFSRVFQWSTINWRSKCKKLGQMTRTLTPPLLRRLYCLYALSKVYFISSLA
ncbi:hypothetical protein QL285_023295 [Trifolium repens]|nr:hypothetical protein QL285_023295 [Trifolium repens]